MNEDTVIVGIDNGLKGGLCAISNWSGDVLDTYPMPVAGVGDKNEVHVRGLIDWLLSCTTNIQVVIEEPLKHARSSQAMRSMSISFGKTVGACEARGILIDRVQVGEWQREMLGKKVPKGLTKSFALASANSLWPNEKWLATPRSKVPHDGIVDAALIARYYRDANQ